MDPETAYPGDSDKIAKANRAAILEPYRALLDAFDPENPVVTDNFSNAAATFKSAYESLGKIDPELSDPTMFEVTNLTGKALSKSWDPIISFGNTAIDTKMSRIYTTLTKNLPVGGRINIAVDPLLRIALNKNHPNTKNLIQRLEEDAKVAGGRRRKTRKGRKGRRRATQKRRRGGCWK